METVPLWGQLSILGLSLGLNIPFIVLLARGILATRPQLEQVQKIADTFRDAWDTAMKANEKHGEALNKLVVMAETTQRILEARPPHMHPPGAPVPEGDDGLD